MSAAKADPKKELDSYRVTRGAWRDLVVPPMLCARRNACSSRAASAAHGLCMRLNPGTPHIVVSAGIEFQLLAMACTSWG